MTRFSGNESNVYIIGEKRQDPFSDDLRDMSVLEPPHHLHTQAGSMSWLTRYRRHVVVPLWYHTLV